MGTELAIFNRDRFLALADEDRLLALKENTAGEKFDINLLPQVKTPQGGATVWTINTVVGEEIAKDITGVLVAIGKRRTLWATNQPGSGELPICSSLDLENGHLSCSPDEFNNSLLQAIGKMTDRDPTLTEPGNACATCAMAQFGTALKSSGEEGLGQRCKESRQFFVLRPGDTMPLVVSAQPGSLKPARQFLFGLPIAHYTAVVSLTLKKENSKGDNTAYSQVVPSLVGQVKDADTIKLLKQFYTNPINAAIGKLVVAD